MTRPERIEIWTPVIMKLIGWLLVILFVPMFFGNLLSAIYPEEIGKLMLFDDGGANEPTPDRFDFVGSAIFFAGFVVLGFALLRQASKVASDSRN